MQIEVTQEHIEKGQQSNCVACPVALALRERLDSDVTLYVASDHVFMVKFPHRVNLRLSAEVQKFIAGFDNKASGLNPFEFELDIPQEYLAESATNEDTSNSNPHR